MAIADINEARIRRWRKEPLDAGVSAVTLAKAYRLLKAIMNTAVDDGLIRRNPCRVKGAGQERSPERPVLTVAQVYALADAIDPRYQALVLPGALGSLRSPRDSKASGTDLARRRARANRSRGSTMGQGADLGKGGF